ncbi:MAG: metal ABC transporter permease [Smithella sp.]
MNSGDTAWVLVCCSLVLLIPALTAHMFARNMRQFTIIASLLGGATAFMGFCIAYQWDLPVGPTDVVFLGVLYATGWIITKLLHGNISLKSREG